MKHWIICIIVLNSLIAPVRACGPYYPYGEDVRFSIFNPAAFGYSDFCGFHYSASLYYGDDCLGTNEASGRAQNVLLWSDYCKNKVDTGSIYHAIYVVNDRDFPNSAMIKYFLQTNDTTAINYLTFARRCNDFNSWIEDPWERNDQVQASLRTPLINHAQGIINTTKNKFIQQRYAFLAMRLAFYNGDEKIIRNLYDRYFSVEKKKKNIVDYWALYFGAMVETNRAKQNYYLALVFANAPDKRIGVSQHYNNKIPLASILAFAKNSSEKTAVCLMSDLKNVGKGLAELKMLYQLQQNSQAFSFLLLREKFLHPPEFELNQPIALNFLLPCLYAHYLQIGK